MVNAFLNIFLFGAGLLVALFSGAWLLLSTFSYFGATLENFVLQIISFPVFFFSTFVLYDRVWNNTGAYVRSFVLALDLNIKSFRAGADSMAFTLKSVGDEDLSDALDALFGSRPRVQFAFATSGSGGQDYQFVTIKKVKRLIKQSNQ